MFNAVPKLVNIKTDHKCIQTVSYVHPNGSTVQGKIDTSTKWAKKIENCVRWLCILYI